MTLIELKVELGAVRMQLERIGNILEALVTPPVIPFGEPAGPENLHRLVPRVDPSCPDWVRYGPATRQTYQGSAPE